MIFKLAWRNLWRNKNRTAITVASVFTAVIVALLMRSAQLGSYQNMIANMVSFYTGSIQIHDKGYWNEQSLDKSFVINDSLVDLLKKTADISCYSPRLESFAMASGGQQARGAMIAGIVPGRENEITHLKSKIVSGLYIGDSASSVLLAQGLAKSLNLHVADTLVLFGQGYHGVTAAGLFPVAGILKFPTPDLNRNMVFMPIALARGFLSAAGRVTSVVIAVKPEANSVSLAQSLRTRLSASSFEVMDWRQMLPDLLQLINFDNIGGIITIGILYMVISFGIFSTLLIMLNERIHEFGTMMAIGLKKIQLIKIVTLEVLLISALGIIIGLILSVPVIAYFHFHPIRITGESAHLYTKFGIEPVFPFSMKWSIFLWQALVVEMITVVLAVYPYFRLANLKTIDALKS